MALRRKGSRLISVGGKCYRWTVSRSIHAGTGNISIFIEVIDQPGNRVVARVPHRHFWLNFRDWRDAPPEGYPGAFRPVTPEIVQKIIAAVQKAGWPIESQQRNVAYEWTNEAVLSPVNRKQDGERRLIRKRR